LEFCKRLIKRDDPDIRSNKAKAKLERLRQVDSFDDYLNEFRSISLDTDWPDSELLRRFKEGLKKQTRMHVVSQNPKSLNDAINLACLLEQSMRSFEEKRDEEVNFSKSRRNTFLRGACYN
jgi:phosphoribosylpyrophosphate synthetase